MCIRHPFVVLPGGFLSRSGADSGWPAKPLSSVVPSTLKAVSAERWRARLDPAFVTFAECGFH